jgi:protein O-GlcNAc transferase
MQIDRFLDALASRFDDFPASQLPRDRALGPVLEAVDGLSAENCLALVNCAASLLEPGECYVEAGTFHGRSLIAALLGTPAVEGVGLDDFSFGTDRRQVLANLERFGVAERATILTGDALELLAANELAGRRVGAYLYDAAHTYEAQLAGLELIRPYLAPRALLIVDNSDREEVARATHDFVGADPRASLLLELHGETHGTPWWWDGMHCIAWSASRAR